MWRVIVTVTGIGVFAYYLLIVFALLGAFPSDGISPFDPNGCKRPKGPDYVVTDWERVIEKPWLIAPAIDIELESCLQSQQDLRDRSNSTVQGIFFAFVCLMIGLFLFTVIWIAHWRY